MSTQKQDRASSIVRKAVPLTQEGLRRHLAASESLEDGHGKGENPRPHSGNYHDVSSQKSQLGTASLVHGDESTLFTNSTRPSSFSASAVSRSEQLSTKTPPRAEMENLDEIMATVRLRQSDTFSEASKINLLTLSGVSSHRESLFPVSRVTRTNSEGMDHTDHLSEGSRHFVGFSLDKKPWKPLVSSLETLDPLINGEISPRKYSGKLVENEFQTNSDSENRRSNRHMDTSQLFEPVHTYGAGDRQEPKRRQAHPATSNRAPTPIPYDETTPQEDLVLQPHLPKSSRSFESTSSGEAPETVKDRSRSAGGTSAGETSAGGTSSGSLSQCEDSEGHSYRLGGDVDSLSSELQERGSLPSISSPTFSASRSRIPRKGISGMNEPIAPTSLGSAVRIQPQPIIMSQGGRLVGVIPVLPNLAAQTASECDTDELNPISCPKDPSQTGQQRRAKPQQSGGNRKVDRAARPRTQSGAMSTTSAQATEAPGLPITKRKGLQGRNRQLFACPFAKHRPQRYVTVYNQCTNRPGLESRLLKEHMKRVHSVVWKQGCIWCSWKWTDFGTWYEDFKAHECLVRDNHEELMYHPEPMTQDQEEALDRVDMAHLNTGQDRWVWIYMTLFPGSFPIPFPFYDFTVVNPSIGQIHDRLVTSGSGAPPQRRPPSSANRRFNMYQYPHNGSSYTPSGESFSMPPSSVFPSVAPASITGVPSREIDFHRFELGMGPSFSNTNGFANSNQNYSFDIDSSQQFPNLGMPNEIRGYGEAYHFDRAGNQVRMSGTTNTRGIATHDEANNQHFVHNHAGVNNDSFAASGGPEIPRQAFTSPRLQVFNPVFNSAFSVPYLQDAMPYQQAFGPHAAATAADTMQARRGQSSRDSSANTNQNPTPEDSD